MTQLRHGIVVFIFLTLQAASAQPELSARILTLARDLMVGDAAQMTAAQAESQEIFRSRGLLTIAAVGDEAAYAFMVLTCAKGELEFRESVLTTAKEAEARGALPSDAVSYCEARLRADRAAANAARQPPTHPGVRDEVQQLLAKDQAVRQSTNFDLARMQQVDRENEPAVTAILDRYGVPTIAMVGREAASSFVTLVLHQPPVLRLRVLPQLKAALDVGQADPVGYATLYDRTQRDAGRAQLYGQNLECSSENPRLHRAPIEDEAHVNLRRAGIGLVRLEMYERVASESSPALCGAQVK